MKHERAFIKILPVLLLLLMNSSCGKIAIEKSPPINEAAIKEYTSFCIKAQSIVGGYDEAELRAITKCEFHYNTVPFLKSKPGIKNGSLLLHSYSPNSLERATEYKEIWCKLKSYKEIDKELSITRTGNISSCDKIMRYAIDEAEKISQKDSLKLKSRGFKFSIMKSNKITGSSWSSSKITLFQKGENEIFINCPTLESPGFVPKFGGMNYIKLIPPSQAAIMISDIANNNFDKIPFENSDEAPLDKLEGQNFKVYKIDWMGPDDNIVSREALVFTNNEFKSPPDFKGTYIISPGADIPPESMRGLAKSIASNGFVVFIVKYPFNYAISEIPIFHDNSAVNLAGIIKNKNADVINSLPKIIKDFLKNNQKVSVIGHSLGGAVLGTAIFGDSNPFDNIILYGTTSFIEGWGNEPPAKADNIASFIGKKDALCISDEKKIDALKDVLELSQGTDDGGIQRSSRTNRYLEILNDLNHFCIISDKNEGSSSIRKKDKIGPPPSECVQVFTAHLKKRGLL